MGTYGMHIESHMTDSWKTLVRHYAARCNRFRVDCWKSDAAPLDMFRPYAETESPAAANPAFVVGRLAPELLEAILEDPFRPDGEVKWFSLFLVCDDKTLMSSEHNGGEVILHQLSSEELAWVRSLLPENAHVSTWSEDEVAQRMGDRLSTGPGIEEACLPGEGDGPGLKAVAAAVFSGLLNSLTKSASPPDRPGPED
jgi:hypothetical protein